MMNINILDNKNLLKHKIHKMRPQVRETITLQSTEKTALSRLNAEKRLQ